MKIHVFVSVLLLSMSEVMAQERIIGLLTLPQVFGSGPCDKYSPDVIPLFSIVDAAKPFGEIRVDKYWTFPDEGGCENLVVNVHNNETLSVTALPTEEFEYEAPAAIVFDKDNRWFKIKVSDGVAWMPATERNRYYPLPELLMNRLSYIAEPAGSQVFRHPYDVDIDASVAVGDIVRVLKSVGTGDKLWLYIQVMNNSVCESEDEPEVRSQGWIPAHAQSGRPVVRFYSRGC